MFPFLLKEAGLSMFERGSVESLMGFLKLTEMN